MAIDMSNEMLSATTSDPMDLRFVQRGEKRILQQRFLLRDHFQSGLKSQRFEWRDVPLVEGEAT